MPLQRGGRFEEIMKRKPCRHTPWGAALCLASALIIADGWGAEPAKRIVLIAGPKSHGPGEHEYLQSVKLLKVLLDRAPNVKAVRAEVHFDGWPNDPAVLDHADTIAILSDGDNGIDSH